MLWSTLFNRLGKLPLRITQHQHVNAIINDEHYELDIMFNAKGEPYLVPREKKASDRGSKHVVWYIVSEERPNVLGSGSEVNWVQRFGGSAKEADVMAYLKAHGGNTLERVVTRKNKFVRHWFDFTLNRWRDENNEPLPN